MFEQKLKRLVVIHRSSALGDEVARECARMVEETGIYSDTIPMLPLSPAPDVVIISASFGGSLPVFLKSLARHHPGACVIGCYGELSVSGMARLRKLGLTELLAEPIDFAVLYGLVSRHFGRGFRRHERYRVQIEVLRLDGQRMGVTRDVSEGGMLVDLDHQLPLTPGASFVVQLSLPGTPPVRLRVQMLDVVGKPGEAVSVRVRFETLRPPERTWLEQFFSTQTNLAYT